MISTTEKTTPNITTPSFNITLNKKPMDRIFGINFYFSYKWVKLEDGHASKAKLIRSSDDRVGTVR